MASSKNTPTAAGAKAPDTSASGTSASGTSASGTAVTGTSITDGADKDRLMDAIDRMFAEFELTYHNQFHKAFADNQKLMYAKRLWLSHLGDCSAEEVLAAARQTTRESEYLPTVHSVLKHIEAQRRQGMPEAHDAYREACLAPSPKAAQTWSHPAVYWAGCASDWHLLSTSSERESWPVFARHYRAISERVARGETLPDPALPALPEEIHHPLSTAERKAHVAALRKAIDL